MTTSQHAALLADRDDRPLEAINAYERAITDSQADLEGHINLAVLYFLCSDPGFAGGYHIPDDVVARSTERAHQVLDEALRKFGKHSEVEFWHRYIDFIALGERPFYEEAKNLADEGESLVPYLHLAGQGPYQRTTRQLLESVKKGRTAKERYIKAVLKSITIKDWFNEGR